MVIGIIGAGASGMAAAIYAAKDPQNQVVLFERQSRVGRKLLATGNGRCNLSNQNADPSHYHGQDPAFCSHALDSYDVENTIAWFSSLGLLTVTEPSGRIYPYSDSANSVVDVLRFALRKTNIQLMTGFEVSSAEKTAKGFVVHGPETVFCDRLVIACGGLAGSKLGGSMSGYQLLRGFAHHQTRLRPNLVQLKSNAPFISALKGVRANCQATIMRKGEVFAMSKGEIQFTDYGVSGPVIFEISRDVCQGTGPWECRLDLLPDTTFSTLYQMLSKRVQFDLTCEDLLTGILHNRLGRILVRESGLSPTQPLCVLSDDDLKRVCNCVKEFTVTLTEPMGMEQAQVTAGGILTEEFDSLTMESRLVPGLYACGEVLDIDGDCGGYNLQWAWSSGALAGSSAGSKK